MVNWLSKNKYINYIRYDMPTMCLNIRSKVSLREFLHGNFLISVLYFVFYTFIVVTHYIG